MNRWLLRMQLLRCLRIQLLLPNMVHADMEQAAKTKATLDIVLNIHIPRVQSSAQPQGATDCRVEGIQRVVLTARLQVEGLTPTAARQLQLL
mmetsp:Transcript_49285/g.95267  ORF Transcript_49285/g.95267 Transcript_49285/m.95267 type:complete len:92 (+) Transcript_49285:198-473(+)